MIRQTALHAEAGVSLRAPESQAEVRHGLTEEAPEPVIDVGSSAHKPSAKGGNSSSYSLQSVSPNAQSIRAIEKVKDLGVEFTRLAGSNAEENELTALSIRRFCFSLFGASETFEVWYASIKLTGDNHQAVHERAEQNRIALQRVNAAKVIYSKCSGVNHVSGDEASYFRALNQNFRIGSERVKGGFRVRRGLETGGHLDDFASELAGLRETGHPEAIGQMIRLAQGRIVTPSTGSEVKDLVVSDYIATAAACSSDVVLCDEESFRSLETCLYYAACDGASADAALVIKLAQLGIDAVQYKEYVDGLRRRLLGQSTWAGAFPRP
jgi:hypothetical protein